MPNELEVQGTPGHLEITMPDGGVATVRRVGAPIGAERLANAVTDIAGEVTAIRETLMTLATQSAKAATVEDVKKLAGDFAGTLTRTSAALETVEKRERAAQQLVARAAVESRITDHLRQSGAWCGVEKVACEWQGDGSVVVTCRTAEGYYRSPRDVGLKDGQHLQLADILVRVQ